MTLAEQIEKALRGALPDAIRDDLLVLVQELMRALSERLGRGSGSSQEVPLDLPPAAAALVARLAGESVRTPDGSLIHFGKDNDIGTVTFHGPVAGRDVIQISLHFHLPTGSLDPVCCDGPVQPLFDRGNDPIRPIGNEEARSLRLLDRFCPWLALGLVRWGVMRCPPELDLVRDYLEAFAKEMAQLDVVHYGPPLHYVNVTGQLLHSLPAPDSPYREAPKRGEVLLVVRRSVRLLSDLSQGGDQATAQLAGLDRASQVVWNVASLLRRHKEPLILLGDPGSGKSMTLRTVGLDIARAGLGQACPPVVIYVRLGQYRAECNGQPDAIWTLIKNSIPARFAALRDLLPYLAQQRRLIILFDGMDEMERRFYGPRVLSLSDFASENAGHIKTLFTCRINDFSPRFIHRQLVLLDFDRRQVREYLTHNLHPREILIDRESFTPVQLAYRLLNSTEWREVARNPLTLYLLCAFFRKRQSWPRTRHELFDNYLQFLFAQLPVRDDEAADWDRVCDGWAQVAFRMTNWQATSLPLGDLNADKDSNVREAIKTGLRCGLLLRDESDEESVRFAHHRLQEYLTACYLARHGAEYPDLNWASLIDTPRWQETLINLASIQQEHCAVMKVLQQSLGEQAEEEDETGTKQGIEAAETNPQAEASREQAEIERQLADRVVLASRVVRELGENTNKLPPGFLERLTRSVEQLARNGRPTTQVKMLWAWKNVETCPLDALEVPLQSTIHWVREQAIQVAAEQPVSRMRTRRIDLRQLLAQDVASGRLLPRLPAYVRAVSASGDATLWSSLVWALVARLLHTTGMIGMVFAVYLILLAQPGAARWLGPTADLAPRLQALLLLGATCSLAFLFRRIPPPPPRWARLLLQMVFRSLALLYRSAGLASPARLVRTRLAHLEGLIEQDLRESASAGYWRWLGFLGAAVATPLTFLVLPNFVSLASGRMDGWFWLNIAIVLGFVLVLPICLFVALSQFVFWFTFGLYVIPGVIKNQRICTPLVFQLAVRASGLRSESLVFGAAFACGTTGVGLILGFIGLASVPWNRVRMATAETLAMNACVLFVEYPALSGLTASASAALLAAWLWRRFRATSDSRQTLVLLLLLVLCPLLVLGAVFLPADAEPLNDAGSVKPLLRSWGAMGSFLIVLLALYFVRRRFHRRNDWLRRAAHGMLGLWFAVWLIVFAASIDAALEAVALYRGFYLFTVLLLMGLAVTGALEGLAWCLRKVRLRGRQHGQRPTSFAEWRQLLEQASPDTQYECLKAVSVRALGIEAVDLLRWLEQSESWVQHEPAASQYWRTRHALEETIRQERLVSVSSSRRAEESHNLPRPDGPAKVAHGNAELSDTVNSAEETVSRPRRGRVVLRWMLCVPPFAALAAIVGSQLVKNNQPVYVVNGLPEAVVVELGDQKPFRLQSGAFRRLRLPEGTYDVRYQLEDEQRQQRVTIASGFLDRLTEDRLYVINLEGAALLQLSSTLMREVDPATRQTRWHGMSIDYHFGKPLHEINRPAQTFEPLGTGPTGDIWFTSQLDFADELPDWVFESLPRAYSPAAKLDLAEKYLRANLDNISQVGLLRAYVKFARRQGQPQRCQKFVSAILDRFQPLPGRADYRVMVWYVAWQDLTWELEGPEAVIPASEKRIAADPDNPVWLVLTARMHPSAARAMELLERAIQMRPAKSNALHDKCRILMWRGDFEAARRGCQQALDLSPDDQQHLDVSLELDIATGDMKRASNRLEEWWQGKDKEAGDSDWLMPLDVLSNQPKQARQRHQKASDAFASRQEKQPFVDWSAPRARSAVRLYYQLGEAENCLQAAQELPEDGDRQWWVAAARLELGQYTEVAQGPEFFPLLASIGQATQGQAQPNAEWWKATKALRRHYPGVARLLAQDAPPDLEVVMDLNIQAHQRAAVLLALAQRFPQVRASFLAQAARLAYTPFPPGQFLRRSVEAVKGVRNQPRVKDQLPP